MKIGLLTTGNEILNGDILDTNCQALSSKLHAIGANIGMHLSCSDELCDLKTALQFLLGFHDIVITTGGLGPTSDDRTRYAIADVTDCPLQLDEATWQKLQARLVNLPPINLESNRQQALFPKGATLYPNPNGTAPGCRLTFQEKVIYMLPGPPRECLPMFDEHVIIDIKNRLNQRFITHYLRLFGIGESTIAPTLDAITAPYGYQTSFRWHYPYIDFKVRTTAEEDISDLLRDLQSTIAPLQICRHPDTASSAFMRDIIEHQIEFTIHDFATGGLLQQALQHPNSHRLIQFHEPRSKVNVTINGLTDYWSKQPTPGETTLSIEIADGDTTHSETLTIPYRNQQICDYAVELICHQLQKYFFPL